jgi:hypothetical protein
VLLLDMRITDVDLLPHNEHVDLVSSLLQAVADLSPVELRFSITPTPSYTLNVALPGSSTPPPLSCTGWTSSFRNCQPAGTCSEARDALPLSPSAAYATWTLILHCPRLRVFRTTRPTVSDTAVLELHLTPTRLDYNKRSISYTQRLKIVLLRSRVIYTLFCLYSSLI